MNQPITKAYNSSLNEKSAIIDYRHGGGFMPETAIEILNNLDKEYLK